jgi:hypothetical protein
MINNMYCPLCSSEIKFSYVTPEQSFVIVDGVIKRDDAWHGPEYDNPHFHFYCSNDKEHDLDYGPELDKWCEDIENEYRQNLLA